MGIKGNFLKFLKELNPQICTVRSISDYKNKIIAIDMSIYINRFKASFHEDWKKRLMSFAAMLYLNDLKPIIIFDGGSPPEKDEEKKLRRKNKEQLCEKINKLTSDLEEYKKTNHISPLLRNHGKLEESFEAPIDLSLTEENTSTFNVSIVENYLRKIKQNYFEIFPEDFATTREMFDIFGFPCITAPMEAETLCGILCKKGLVDAVMTDDTDIFVYGCPITLRKLDFKTETVDEIKYSDILDAMKFTSHQFLDFCIMCGVDYNKNINGISTKKSYDYITKYKNIDHIPILDTTILNHIKCRELFQDTDISNILIPPRRNMDMCRLKTFVSSERIKFDITKLNEFHSTIF